ncbi:FemAB family XrtA/PEP-CTERM system-associated protein [Novipirellula sp.]|uniref:FemAB family XrtA/PEP-CTERM system-associated protein n=1 Tax=Novipirellula sp. TaxID=2795430 RepID=UPI0035689840
MPRTSELRVQCSPIDQLNTEDDQRAKQWAQKHGIAGTHASPNIVRAVCRGLSHRGYWIQATRGGEIVGVLPLVDVNTMLFGRYLVSLPYLNWGGVVATDVATRKALIDRAVTLADELDVRFLELRHETAVDHEKLSDLRSEKVQMRMPVVDEEQAWKGCRSTVRTQVRKGDKQDFDIRFGGHELMPTFFKVFSENMRDLGTPVYSLGLFSEFLDQMGDQAELCVVQKAGVPIACAMTLHFDQGLSEVPSASALRAHRKSAVNTWMYWQLIRRSIHRGANTFDFGRSTPEGPTFDFKRKWGATPSEVAWQYYRRKGDVNAVRPDNAKYGLAIAAWQKLPLPIANLIGPSIVRGIP